MNRDETIAKRIAEAGDLYRPLMRKAYAGDCSPRSAIKAQCLICVGYDRGGYHHLYRLLLPVMGLPPLPKPGGFGMRVVVPYREKDAARAVREAIPRER